MVDEADLLGCAATHGVLALKLLTVIVTHNRLEYTKRAVDSYWKNIGNRAAKLVIVDNASDDGTREWLRDEQAYDCLLNDNNLFPGAAVNLGWHAGLQSFDADLLHRSDNDIEYLPGWRDKMEDAFARLPHLGQLGVLNAHEDFPDGPPYEERWGIYLTNPGGNSVVRREIYDAGFRWEPGPWRPGGNDEDTRASVEIQGRGWIVGRVKETIANNMSFGQFNAHPAYYRKTAALRGLVPETSV